MRKKRSVTIHYNNKCVGYLSTSLCIEHSLLPDQYNHYNTQPLMAYCFINWNFWKVLHSCNNANNNVVGIYIMNWKWLVFIMHYLESAGIFFKTCKSSFFHALLSLSRGLFYFFICSYFTVFLNHSPIYHNFVLYPSHSLSLSLCFSQSATGAVTRAADPCVVTVCSAWRDTSCRMAFVCQDAHWDSTRMLRDVWVSHQQK